MSGRLKRLPPPTGWNSNGASRCTDIWIAEERRCRCSSSPTAPASARRRWATRCSSSSPTCASSDTLIPFITTVEEARRVVAILDEAMAGRSRRWPSRPPPSTEIRDELHTIDVPADRLLRPAHAPGRGDPRRHGSPGRRAAARRRRHQALQRPDGGGRVRDRARRRPEPAGPGQGRRHPARAVALRQDADHHVPRAAARPVRRQLPAGPTRTSTPPTCPRPVRRRSRPLLRPHHHRRRGSARCAASGGPNSSYASPRAVHATSCAGPRPSTAATASPSINSSAKSVEEMSTVIMQIPASRAAHRDLDPMKEPDMSSNVLWFSELGMADLEQVGGKNASLGEMVSQPRRPRGAGARRLRHDRRRLPALHRRHRPGRARSAAGSTAWTPTTSPSSPEVGQRDPRRGRRRSRSRADLEADIRAAYERLVGERRRRRLVRGALQRDRGGPARRVVRRSAGDVPQRPRHRRDPDRDPRGVRLALQRPGDRLPGAPRLRPRRRRAVGGGAADGALGRRRLRA